MIPLGGIIEGNIDGLVGPTHHYGGLAYGNIASGAHGGSVSFPRAAALQGLDKMKRVAELGIPQLVMPPLLRPKLCFLHAAGFHGTNEAIIARAAAEAPKLLACAYSAASMWVANAATVTASADNADGKVHFTPANLLSTPHRALEANDTANVLKRIFVDDAVFYHHLPLPANPMLADEGAANHMRLRGADGVGVNILVYGRDDTCTTTRYPARQARAASAAVARLHGLDDKHTMLIRQRPEAIDAGVFHNDVIATSHGALLLYHEYAFTEDVEPLLAPYGLTLRRISEKELPLADAVSSYFFNSQIVDIPGGGMLMLAPKECAANAKAAALIAQLLSEDIGLTKAEYVDLTQSMQNGGGPACLRLRLPLTEREWDAVHPGVRFSDALYGTLVAWVERYYPEKLHTRDLADPVLLKNTFAAMQALEEILDLKGLYAFDH